MAWSSVARFSDPVDCQRSIQGAAGLEIFPTTRGNFATEVTKIRFDRLWMQRFHSSLPQIISCEHLPDRQAISFTDGGKITELVLLRKRSATW